MKRIFRVLAILILTQVSPYRATVEAQNNRGKTIVESKQQEQKDRPRQPEGTRSVIASSLPHILLILADDLAWSDLGCYGHPWHDTPNLDGLASSGMRFTNAYSPAPICSASRASLLTGKTTARLGFEFVTKNEAGFQSIDQATPLRAPAYQLNLELRHDTIAEHLNPLGYRSEFAGKWHLNAHHGGYLGWSPTHGPQQQGFRQAIEDFGSHPYSWKKQKPPTLQKEGSFAEDSLIKKISHALANRRHDEPNFYMASLYHVHTPVKTTCDWLIDKYQERIPAETPARERRVRYAAFVETLDHHVGQLLQSIRTDKNSRHRETLVLFTSDNGGHPEYTANAPFRGSKWNLYEGGIRVPLLASWPGTISPNSTTDRPVVGYDILPTLIDLCSLATDETESTENLDGVSFADTLLSIDRNDLQKSQPATQESTRDIFWHFPYYHPETGYAAAIEEIGIDDFKVSKTHPHSAIRRGDYKLIWFPETDSTELYDVKKDPAESKNLNTTFPQKTDSLKQSLLDYLHRVNARFPLKSR